MTDGAESIRAFRSQQQFLGDIAKRIDIRVSLGITNEWCHAWSAANFGTMVAVMRLLSVYHILTDDDITPGTIQFFLRLADGLFQLCHFSVELLKDLQLDLLSVKVGLSRVIQYPISKYNILFS